MLVPSLHMQKLGPNLRLSLPRSLCCVWFSLSVLTDSATMDYMQLARLLRPWGFSRQEYWSGEPIPSPGDLPDPGIESRSPALALLNSLPAELPGKPNQ